MPHRPRFVASRLLLPAFGSLLALGCSTGTGPVGGADGPGATTGGSKLGGSIKNTTCKNTEVSSPRSAKDSACDACAAEKCLPEAHALLGADPNAFGGACGEHQQCVCDCDAANQSCEAGCDRVSSNAECNRALEIAIGCLIAKCSAAGC